MERSGTISTYSNNSVPPVDGSVTNTYRIGELFAGAGGMAVGAHQARFRNCLFSHVWANDCDRDACQTFVENIPIQKTNVHCCDVSTLNFEQLANIDGLVFGFPCNDFSVVGDRRGIDGKFGGLYKHGIRALISKKPLFFVAENVSGISSSGNALQIIENELVSAGYNTFKKLYKFEDYGIPQYRHRIIIVGFRKDTEISEFLHPVPTSSEHPISCQEGSRRRSTLLQ